MFFQKKMLKLTFNLQIMQIPNESLAKRESGSISYVFLKMVSSSHSNNENEQEIKKNSPINA